MMNTQTLDRIVPTSVASLCLAFSVPFAYMHVNPYIGIMMIGVALFLLSIVVCEAIEDMVLPEFLATGGLLIILYAMMTAIVDSTLWAPVFLILFVASRFMSCNWGK